MKVNTKIRYGLRAMLDIAMNAKNQGVFQKDIANRQGISVKYLDQIIAALKSAHLIVNVAGKKSGYRLARPADQISVYHIYRAFEPEITLNQHQDSSPTYLTDNCACKDVWDKLNLEIESFLIEQNLQHILKEQHKYQSLAEATHEELIDV